MEPEPERLRLAPALGAPEPEVGSLGFLPL